MFILYSPSKLNLTLRVVGRRNDGYHDIVSLFRRNDATEQLTICFNSVDNVNDSVETSPIVVQGKNIVSRCISDLREEDAFRNIPRMDVHIRKVIPPGTGIGAGSGNAAAFLRWVSRYAGAPIPEGLCESIGADIPFLFDGSEQALVGGIGNVQRSLPPGRKHRVVLVIPEWFSDTGHAFSSLDRRYRDEFPLSEEEASAESLEILSALDGGERVGLLPNDFSEFLFEEHPEYETLAKIGYMSGASGFGISGSGSAFFYLVETEDAIRWIMNAAGSLQWCMRFITMG
jgi:4-diphosphocytidyl-2-C-methyl-D-erythritol kinase